MYNFFFFSTFVQNHLYCFEGGGVLHLIVREVLDSQADLISIYMCVIYANVCDIAT